jgi:hypothetical protein
MKNVFVCVCLFCFLLCMPYASNSFGEESHCEDLIQFKMESYNVVINKAGIIQEGRLSPNTFGASVYDGVMPEYCRIDGEIDKRIGHDGKPYAIGFAMSMPKNWNCEDILL